MVTSRHVGVFKLSTELRGFSVKADEKKQCTEPYSQSVCQRDKLLTPTQMGQIEKST